MARAPLEIDRNKVRTTSAKRRPSKVDVRDEAVPHTAGATLRDFVDHLPNILGGADLRAAIDAWARAWRGGRPVVFGFGAHLIKVGLAPIVVDLLERGAISAIAMNGAGCVHDLELAMMGKTSEDVATALDDGTFGMARETGEALNAAIASGFERGLGMGEAIGQAILAAPYAHKQRSVLATTARLGVPATVHVAIGTDIHHMHASASGEALGATSFRDFEKLAGIVAQLEGGVFLNVGSAVILPEVFLKALALARNLGHRVDRVTTVNLDFLRQYRPSVNVVERPTRRGGRGISLVGQHEILVPLLAAGVIEAASAPAAKQTKSRKRR